MKENRILFLQLRHVVVGMTLPVTLVFITMITLMIIHGIYLWSIPQIVILLFTWIKSWRNNARINYLIQNILNEEQRQRIFRLHKTTVVSMDMRNYYSGVRACRKDIRNGNTQERDKVNRTANADWRIGYTLRRMTRWA